MKQMHLAEVGNVFSPMNMIFFLFLFFPIQFFIPSKMQRSTVTRLLYLKKKKKKKEASNAFSLNV